MEQPILSAHGIYKSFGSNNVLDDVSIDFYPGEVHALIGVNGAGKSTLVKIMQGVYQYDRGQLLLDGAPVKFGGPLDAIEKGISMVFQELNLFGEMSVTENTLINKIPSRLGKISWDRCHEDVGQFLSSIQLDIDPRAKVKDLPMATQQLVEIAKNVYRSPKIIFLDEPSSSLSQTEEKILYDLIRNLKKRGITVVLITHKMDEIFNLCDNITILRDGKAVSTGPVTDYTIEQITHHMLGKSVVFRKNTAYNGDRTRELLAVESVTMGKHVKDVSFSLYKNEILAITGLVGSGKSDLARTIFGVHGSIKGTVALEGRPVAIARPSRTSAQGIGYLPISRKEEGIIQNFSTLQNMTITILDRLGFVTSRKREREIGGRMMETLNIVPRDSRIAIGNLSGGNQQKAMISRWIVGEKKVILLDEPTRGVDVGAKQEIYDRLKQLAADGIGIIIFSSETDELLSASDRILVMHQGKIIKELITSQTSSEEILQYSMTGVSN